MSRHHEDGHAERLDELFAAAKDIARALDGTELAACAECQQALQEHLEIVRLLDGMGEEERDVLAGAASEADALPGAAERALRAEVLGQRPRSLARWIPLVAAAAAVLAIVLLRPDPEPPFDPGTKLGGEELEMVPEGSVPDFSEFHWKHELAPEGWYKVYVYRVSDDGALTLLDESPRLRESRWAPAEASHRSWPDRIRWNLEIHSGATASDVPASYYRLAERSP